MHELNDLYDAQYRLAEALPDLPAALSLRRSKPELVQVSLVGTCAVVG